jgi:D-serine deaminase-like pyridoxal phosphate-dependent protein
VPRPTRTSLSPARLPNTVRPTRLALSKDRSRSGLDPARDCGYGLRFDASGREHFASPRVADVYQEHGVIEARDGASIDFDRLPPGARIRIVPIHPCMTCSADDAYPVVEGERVVAVWPRIHE